MLIKIPLIPNSINKYMGRKNVWEYRAEKKEWLEMGQWLINAPDKPLKKANVEITYFFPTKARHDPDNYCGKVIMDMLVDRGVIKDDSFDCVNLSLCGKYDKLDPRTEIRITGVGNE